MGTHQPLQEDRNRFGQRKDMGTQTPKAASSKASFGAGEHSYPVLPTSSVIQEDASDRPISVWHKPLASREGPLPDERCSPQQASRTTESGKNAPYIACPPPPATAHYLDLTEELAQTLVTMFPEDQCPRYRCTRDHHHLNGEELAEAFIGASSLPPVTKQSLGELDVQNIINSIKLRHDVNFDSELSFRPNTDGVRGQEKGRTAQIYWTSLVAELELYNRLFQGSPAIQSNGKRNTALVHHVKRRLPLMFQTVQEVLLSLVPDRDHSRVQEHLDVSMLMQEIERGVCDMVRLAEWIAQLLKEHCAPMRDSRVDEMVAMISEGVSNCSRRSGSSFIVEGLRNVLGILEAMKLDVANHQIRNLKTLLIADTVNFEQHYHLDRLVNLRSRVNIDIAQAWYMRATWEFAEECLTHPRDRPRLQFEMFVRAIIAQFFNRNGRHEFPETFYLDQDRLRIIKAEIEDLIHVEVCMDMYMMRLRQSGLNTPLSLTPALRQQLHTRLLAVMGEATGYGSQQWVMNSEALSLEILRQASLTAGLTEIYDHARLSEANKFLLQMFCNSFRMHNPHLETTLLHKVLRCTERHSKSTSMELFNSLVSHGNRAPPAPTHFAHLAPPNTSMSNTETLKWQDIANRITHIIILHWRVWERIAYIQEEGHENSSTATMQPVKSVQPPLAAAEQDSQVVAAMRTGEPRESGQDSHVAPETPLQ